MEQIKRWWSQPCGAKELLAISLPLIASTISLTVMQFCDRLFLTWYSNDALAAALPAAAFAWTLYSFPMGVAYYCSTFVAQYFGADQRDKIGAIVWQSIWVGIICIPIYLALGFSGEVIFRSLGHSPEISQLEHQYFLAIQLGAGAIILDAGISSFFVGQGKTNIVMLVNFFGTGINLVLDYWFIFGGFGLPEMGLWGAGIATSISIWAKVIVFAVLFFSPRYASLGTRTHWRINWPLMRRFFRYGLPSGAQLFVEGMAVTFFLIIVPQLSERASSATTVVISINMLVIYPIFGLGMGCSTLVGQKIGERNAKLASRATWNALTLGLAYTLVLAGAYLFAPKIFLLAHASESNEFEEIQPLVLLYLKFVAAYCIFDTVQIIFSSAIKGAGDTRFVVAATIVSSILFVLGGVIGANFFEMPLQRVNWWWICLTGWLIMLCFAHGFRFFQGKWKNMSVIDHVDA